MKLIDLLDKRSISLESCPGSKQEALDEAIALMVKSGNICNAEAYRRQVYLRETEGTTGIGRGIALPHGTCASVKKPGLAAMVLKNGVDFESLDQKPVYLLFLIAVPETQTNLHLDIISKLSVLLREKALAKKLMTVKDSEGFWQVLNTVEKEIEFL